MPHGGIALAETKWQSHKNKHNKQKKLIFF